jgi:hypothetical protein
MKSVLKLLPVLLTLGRFSGVLAVLCALKAMTDPAAPEAVTWIGIPLIALTAWLAVRHGSGTAFFQPRA